MISKRARRLQPLFASADETERIVAPQQQNRSIMAVDENPQKRKLPSNFLLLADETLSESDESPLATPPDTARAFADVLQATPVLLSRQQSLLPAETLQVHALIVDPTPGSVAQYRIAARLGAGAWAANYKALDLIQNRYVTLKRFFYVPRATNERVAGPYRPASETGHFESVEVMREAAEQEYRISLVIKKRSENLLAGSDIVCAEKMFSVSAYEVYIVFPYVEARDLNTYMQTVIAPAISGTASQRTTIIGDVLRIVTNILKIVARLSAIGVAHSDLTPGNILITMPDGVIKLIDLGLGCNFPDLLSESIDRTTEEELDTRCDYQYRTTLRYKDPLADHIQLVPGNVKYSYEMFAVYACGVIARQLFDDLQTVARPVTEFVKIDKPNAMPAYVYTLIHSMTSSNINSRLRASDYAVRFEIARERYLRETQQQV